ncbi:MAG TPA: phosphatase PAP2 family protein [Bacteroidetes bacterium]|nr:phosphatase PAP2 family protein [Bacteroidota bacterium]
MEKILNYDIHLGMLSISLFVLGVIIFSLAVVALYRFVEKHHQFFEKYHLYILILNIFALFFFAKMLEDVVNHDMITQIDVWVNHQMTLWWNPTLNQIMIFITNIISPLVLLSITGILFVYLWYKKQHYRAILLGFSLASGLASFELIKLIIRRARPENALIHVAEYSFPSGHSTMAIIFFSMLIFTLKDGIKNRILKSIFIAFNIILFLTIAFSRVYLDVHWLSDVLGGLSLGLFWTTFYILILKMYKEYYKTGNAKWLEKLSRKKRIQN